MNISNWNHALLSVIAQAAICAIGLLSGLGIGLSLTLGAVFPIGFYFGREVAQAERKAGTPPWYSGFVLTKWSKDGLFDFIVPSVAVSLIALGGFALELRGIF